MLSGVSLISPAVPVPVISSATTAAATVGTAFSYQITASNTPTSYAATGLPGGLASLIELLLARTLAHQLELLLVRNG